MKTTHRILLPALIMGLIFACRKTPSSIYVSPDQVAVTAAPANPDFSCTQPVDFGDTIIYPQPAGSGDYIIYPLNANSLGKGKYLSWPVGLMMDSSTGAIDVTQSQTGLRYIVGFAKPGSPDTCLRNLILAGVTYVDSIYDLGAGDTLAIPYFNANANTPSPCDTSDDTDYPGNSGTGNSNGNGTSGNGSGSNNGKGNGDNKCFFDGKDNKGNGGQANKKNIKVRTISGIINLQATLNDGAFGPNPINGATVTVPVYYTLNDNSKKALQVINVNVTYYDTRADVPASLVQTIETNRNAFFNNTPILGMNPRPPLIVIVRRGF